MLEIKNYRENGTLIAFDNSLYSRRLYDKINSRIKYSLSSASKEELELYKKLGFESSVLDHYFSQYIEK